MNKLLRNRITIPWTPFYRRYPYSDGISINSADARGLLDFDLGVFCNRIPKAANSSVVVNLAYRRYGSEIPSREAKKLFRAPSQLRGREVERLPELFRFAFVRNPYTRVLSAFLDKVDRRERQKNREASFLEFLEYLEKDGLFSNAHWAPQTSLLLIPFEEFDFFGKTENLDEDMSFVLDQIQGHKENKKILSALGNATSAASKLATYYDDQAKAKVEKLYRQDFERFGYPTTLPTKPEPPSSASTTAAQGQTE
ncbi:sulfotransferase family protein [Vreelandella utahensis]|uniref:sulfotransferase family protein n=1 Tax=Vreelandella halophila TaxID=86177 RepID=UPI000986423E|nr:sulfotransferase family protein [Halomonas utahensis]